MKTILIAAIILWVSVVILALFHVSFTTQLIFIIVFAISTGLYIYYKSQIFYYKQIKVIKYAIKNYDNWTKDTYSGLCLILSHYWKRLYPKDDCLHINKYIPLFNREDILKLSVKYNFEAPHSYNTYWWNHNDKKIRLQVLKAMLTELQNTK